MKGSKALAGAALWLLAASVGCGGDESPELGATAPAWQEAADGEPDALHNRAPVIEALRLEPDEPAPGERVRAVARVAEPDGESFELGYVWSVAGRTLAADGPEIALRGAARGDRVEVRVTASDGRAQSDSVLAFAIVRNRRPVVTDLELRPSGNVARGESIAVTASGRDPDGDPLEYGYAWSVNGEEVLADGPRFETADLRKGDAIQVRVWADDGADESDAIWSEAVRVANGHPEILSSPSGMSEDGVFRYAIRARDPDGDRNLRYQLKSGPDGMSLSPITGEVLWKPSASQVGTHPVQVVVEDTEGARTIQEFELEVASSDADATPAAPAD
jgi:hypothetical protein